jgi:hypothetical protein
MLGMYVIAERFEVSRGNSHANGGATEILWRQIRQHAQLRVLTLEQSRTFVKAATNVSASASPAYGVLPVYLGSK